MFRIIYERVAFYFIKEWVMPRVDDVLKWNKKRDATITGNRDYCYNGSSNLSL